MHYEVKKMSNDTLTQKINYKTDAIMTQGCRFPTHDLQHYPLVSYVQ